MAQLDAIQAAAKAEKILPETASQLETWLRAEGMPQWALDSIAELVGNDEWQELDNRFYKQMSFGTGGMRGPTISGKPTNAETGKAQGGATPAHPAVGSAVLNDFNVIRATIGLFQYAQEHLRQEVLRMQVPKLVIAHDVRHFSRHFTELAAATWTRLGGMAMIFEGPRSTPQLSFAVRHLKATCGVVITASHNPPKDNGYKVYFDDGAQIVEPHASKIIEKVNACSLEQACRYLEVDTSEVVVLPDSIDAAYREALEENVLDATVFEDAALKIVFTPIHGTGSISSLPALEGFGVKVVQVPEQEKMDSNFSTVKSPNPENAEALDMAIQKADAEGIDLVMATDPDADRMGVAVRGKEGKMVLLTGNQIGALMADYRIATLKEGGVIPEEGSESAALIKTFVTSRFQDAIAESHGLKVINTLTGFKWIGEKLRHYEEILREQLLAEEGLAIDYDATKQDTRAELMLDYSTFFVFGGEESYGYLGSDRVRDKDANAAVLIFCEMVAWLKAEGMSVLDYLDSLYLKHGYYAEQMVNIYHEGASGAAKIKNILDSYRSDPPKELGKRKVEKFNDFGREEFRDDDGKKIPEQDLYILELTGNYKVAVRGSGTEPKIKFYLFARDEVSGETELEKVKENTRAELDKLAQSIKADAEERTG